MRKWLCGLLALVFCVAVMPVIADGAVPEGYPDVRPDIDFGGATIYIYDYWSGDGASRAESPTEAQAARYDYEDWLMATYNCTIVQKQAGDWGSQATEFNNFVAAPDGSYRVYIVEPGSVTRILNEGTAASWDSGLIDLSGEEWNHATADLFTVDGKTYGVGAGASEPRQMLYFNKRILREAGITWNDLYDMQANGTWTWSAFESLLRQVRNNTNAYGLTGSSDDFYRIAVFSNGGTFFDTDENGELVSTANSDVTLAALNWARSVWNTYSMPQPTDGSWDWYKTAWKNGNTAFYMYQAYGGFNDNSEMSGMADDWGAVAFPKGPNGTEYVNIVSDNVTLMPDVYDDDTASKLAFIYNMWILPTPGYENDDSWIGNKLDYTDERAVLETYAMLRENGHCVTDKTYLLGTTMDVLGGSLLWSLSENTADDLVESAMPTWQALCDDFNTNMSGGLIFSCTDGVLKIHGKGEMPADKPWAVFSQDATEIVVTGRITSICEGAFQGFSNVTSVTLPVSVTAIGDAAFDGCTSLTEITYSGTQAQWDRISIGSLNDALDGVTMNVKDWEVSNGTLTVAASAVERDYDWDQMAPWYSSAGTIRAVVITGSPTRIGNLAFNSLYNLTSVQIPDSVTEIGYSAFSDSSITDITLPAGLRRLGDYAFGNCTNLTSFTLPAGLTQFDPFAVSGCSAMTDFYVDEGNPSYTAENGLLLSKDRTRLIACPAGLTEVHIPNGVTCVGFGVFDGPALTSIFIPASVTDFPGDVIQYCDSLQTIEVDPGNQVYASYNGALYTKDLTTLVRAAAAISSITFPPQTTDIAQGAFFACHQLRSVTIPGSVTAIGYYAFGNCYRLTSVTLESGFVTIGDWAFTECSDITDLTLPASLKTIGYGAFGDCGNLAVIHYGGSLTDWNALNIEENNGPLLNAELAMDVPSADLILPGDLEVIESEAFAGIPDGSVIFIPESVSSISPDAFGAPPVDEPNPTPAVIIIAPAGSYAESWAMSLGFPVYNP